MHKLLQQLSPYNILYKFFSAFQHHYRLPFPVPFWILYSLLGFPAYSVFIIHLNYRHSSYLKWLMLPSVNYVALLHNLRGVGTVQFTTGILYIHQYLFCSSKIQKQHLMYQRFRLRFHLMC